MLQFPLPYCSHFDIHSVVIRNEDVSGSNVHRDSPHYVDLFRHYYISGEVRSGVRKGACFIVGLCAFAPYMARFVFCSCTTHVACLALMD